MGLITGSAARATILLGIFISAHSSLYIHVTDISFFIYQLLSVFCIAYFIFLLPENVLNGFKTTSPGELLMAYPPLKFTENR
jgi:hypothetical protein